MDEVARFLLDSSKSWPLHLIPSYNLVTGLVEAEFTSLKITLRDCGLLEAIMPIDSLLQNHNALQFCQNQGFKLVESSKAWPPIGPVAMSAHPSLFKTTMQLSHAKIWRESGNLSDIIPIAKLICPNWQMYLTNCKRYLSKYIFVL